MRLGRVRRLGNTATKRFEQFSPRNALRGLLDSFGKCVKEKIARAPRCLQIRIWTSISGSTMLGSLEVDRSCQETRHNVFIFCLGLCTCEVALYLPAGRGPWNWFWPIWCDATLLLTLLVTANISSEGLTWGSRYWSGCYVLSLKIFQGIKTQ